MGTHDRGRCWKLWGRVAQYPASMEIQETKKELLTILLLFNHRLFRICSKDDLGALDAVQAEEQVLATTGFCNSLSSRRSFLQWNKPSGIFFFWYSPSTLFPRPYDCRLGKYSTIFNPYFHSLLGKGNVTILGSTMFTVSRKSTPTKMAILDREMLSIAMNNEVMSGFRRSLKSAMCCEDYI